ncbi:PepSY domain-containing protein [Nocardia donostiensis]|nr:PepSY domain-containing protein [Nocardia donostiensis]
MANVFRHSAAGMRRLLIGVVAVGAGIGITAVALGHGPQGHTVSLDRPITEWSLVADPGIDRKQAMDAAAAAVPDGKAVSAEFDAEYRTAVWEVEVVTPDGVEYEVTIDADTGEVLGTVDHD